MSIEACGIGLFNGMSPGVHPKALFRVLSQINFGSLLNISASLANPARPVRGVRGVYAPELVRPVAETMRAIGYERALVFHGSTHPGANGDSGGMDELSPVGPSTAVEVMPDGSMRDFVIQPLELGMPQGLILDHIAGGIDPRQEAMRLLRIFSGQERGALYETICLNAAPIFFVGRQGRGSKTGRAHGPRSDYRRQSPGQTQAMGGLPEPQPPKGPAASGSASSAGGTAGIEKTPGSRHRRWSASAKGKNKTTHYSERTPLFFMTHREETMATITSVNDIISAIEPADKQAIETAREHTGQLVMPPRALGRLHEMAERICGMQRTRKPDIDSKGVLVMAGDHGVALDGVSAFPQEVTGAMVTTFLAGGAGINAIARLVGAQVWVVDMGIIPDINPRSVAGGDRLKVSKIGLGTASFASGPAMTREQAEKAVVTGFKHAAALFERGVQIVGNRRHGDCQHHTIGGPSAP